MFIFTMKFNKKVAVSILIGIAVVLMAIVMLVGILGGGSRAEGKKQSDGKGIKNNADRIAYLQSLGWECEEDPIDEQKIVIPREFNAVFEEYNQLQKQQGFDLSQYCGLEVTMYRYTVKNYPTGDDVVMAQIMVLNYEVVGGDIHSTAVDGFMHGLK